MGSVPCGNRTFPDADEVVFDQSSWEEFIKKPDVHECLAIAVAGTTDQFSVAVLRFLSEHVLIPRIE